MAASFARYLADRNKLQQVYLSIRNVRFSSDSGAYRTDQEIVKEALGEKLERIDENFARWFEGHR